MNISGRAGLCIGLIIVLGISGTSRGQITEGTVTGTGSATISRAPNLLRMTIELSAEGKDFKSVLEKLRSAEADARKKLLATGAVEQSIKLAEVRDGAVKSQRQLQMEMYARQQMSARGRKPATAPAAQVKLTATLTAEWALSGSGDELLGSTWTLTEKIKSSDVGGKKTASTLTPEQQEEQEEQEGMIMNVTGDPSQGDPREPKFVYVARLTEGEQSRAAADAFAAAKGSAARLAKAAGTELGALRQLSSQTLPTVSDVNENPYSYLMNQAQAGNRSGEVANEAVGPQASGVSVRVMITAAFAVK